MIYPTINKLTQGKYNRYQLAVATAKGARIITNEYTEQRRAAEKNLTGNKETDRAIMESSVNPDYRNRKAVKIAIDKIDSGDFVIIETADNGAMSTEESEHAE
jgi:DNA-directed RNA polymerase subunit K/omega